jgi:hypothetical protein
MKKRHEKARRSTIRKTILLFFLCLFVPFRGHLVFAYLRFFFIGMVAGDAEAEAVTVVGEGPTE